MKKKYLTILLIFCVYFSQAQIVDIPDANFKDALINNPVAEIGNNMWEDVDVNDDGEIQETEAEQVIKLKVRNKNISSLTGIESFINIEFLDLWFNQVTDLDLTQNTNLYFLDCSSNHLLNLDVTQNIHLEHLNCEFNNLSSLNIIQNNNLKLLKFSFNNLLEIDLSGNLLLEEVNFQANNIENIDITQNNSLTKLFCANNQITSLDLSQNSLLGQLFCYGNQLTSLFLPHGTNLYEVNCSYNDLTNLDVSLNPNLGILDCRNNLLTTLDLSQNIIGHLNCSENQLISLNIKNGYTHIISTLNSTENIDLFCIQVDDEEYANNELNWSKDPWAEYSEDCTLGLEENMIKSISFYPNPVNDILNISSLDQFIKEVKIINLQGKVIRLFYNKSTMNLLDLATGMYFIKIESDDNSVIKKMIKN